MIRQRIIFSGRVQGVGFRATAKAIARNHAVTGWVRNHDDGTVLLEVQGLEASVAAFVSDLNRDMARFIRTSAAASIAVVDDEPDFSIRR